MLPCGCEAILEGGYGSDGLSGRLSMEWCDLHAMAQELATENSNLYSQLDVFDLERLKMKKVVRVLSDMLDRAGMACDTHVWLPDWLELAGSTEIMALRAGKQ